MGDYNLMDFQLCLQVGSQIGGKAKYNMLYGRDEQALPALLLGAEAAVSSTVGYAPSLCKADHYWREGNAKEALVQQALNAKLCSFFAEYESQGINVQKGLMKLVGFDVGPSRLPKTDL